jgi:hypothetical protein
MLQARRIWAEEEGLNPDVIENLYQDLVNYFIAEELKHWHSKAWGKKTTGCSSEEIIFHLFKQAIPDYNKILKIVSEFILFAN